MYQRDYILKMIEMLGQFVVSILKRISKKEFKEAEDLLEESYFTLLKESAAKFTFIPKEKLTDQLLSDYNFQEGHLEILAQLFKVEADLRFAQGNSELSSEFYQKALIIFEFFDNNSKDFSIQRKKDTDEIKEKINK
ncbi:MAG: hypothetical protein FWH18_11735 [Marinilabiliaceae bacterium]|nr:hypothetical protein [Marinilabiliaceae bacterium]